MAHPKYHWNALLLFGLAGMALTPHPAIAQTSPAEPLNTGRMVSPSGAVTNVGSMPINVVTTPDGKFALVSDMGFRQSLSVFDLQTGARVSSVEFPKGADDKNGLYYGLAVVPDGANYTVYAGQGGNDSLAVLSLTASGVLTRTDMIPAKRKLNFGLLAPGDTPSGVASGGGRLFVANNSPSIFLSGATMSVEAGSVSVIDPATKSEINRYIFPPFVSALPNYPFAIAALRDGSVVFVASQRDGAVYALSTHDVSASTAPTLLGTIPTGGHPCALLFNKDQTRLYVANATTDTVSVIDPATRKVQQTIALRPDNVRNLPGISPVGLALSPDESRLFVALGDLNAVAQIDTGHGRLLGLIPAGWYPTGVAVSPDGKNLLISNAKGVNVRNPNPTFTPYDPAHPNNEAEYDLNKIEGTVNYLPIPAPSALPGLTRTVLENSRTLKKSANPLAGIGRKAGKIKHVFYIIKENRTYDQVLGDLPGGDGKPDLAIFGQTVTPNLHALAQRFVLMDRFFVCGEASGDGWCWSTRSYANEYVIKNLPYNYSGRSADSRYDFEGQNNGYLVGGHPAKDVDGKPLSRLFPNGASPVQDIADGPNGAIWDAVKRAKLPYRNYGFGLSQGAAAIVPDNYPGHAGLQPEGHDLAGISDYDFRRFDLNYADSDGPALYNAPFRTKTYGKHGAGSRFAEFKNEFSQMLAKDPTGDKSVPAFVMVRFMSDHTNGAAAGQPTPRAYVADNDYAIGQFVDLISHSPIWNSTAIFIIEDDAQDGPDHVDAHRSTGYVISPWIRKNAVDHGFYNTDSMLKTMELLLDIAPLSQYDAFADPIGNWDTKPSNSEPFTALMPDRAILTERNPSSSTLRPGSPEARLAALSAAMDFSRADSADPALLNAIIWQTVKGTGSKMPAPVHSGIAIAQPHSTASGIHDEDDEPSRKPVSRKKASRQR